MLNGKLINLTWNELLQKFACTACLFTWDKLEQTNKHKKREKWTWTRSKIGAESVRKRQSGGKKGPVKSALDFGLPAEFSLISSSKAIMKTMAVQLNALPLSISSYVRLGCGRRRGRSETQYSAYNIWIYETDIEHLFALYAMTQYLIWGS